MRFRWKSTMGSRRFALKTNFFVHISILGSFLLYEVSGESEPRYDDKYQIIMTSMKPENKMTSQTIDNLGFLHAFIASLSVIVVSELGDKTFFIAAIMAMKHPRLTVFVGAISALAFMTILSVIFGYAATIIPRAYTHYISTLLFALFGLKMLKDGYYMSGGEGQEELEEVQSDLRKRDDEYEKETGSTLIQDPETGVIRKTVKNGEIVHNLQLLYWQQERFSSIRWQNDSSKNISANSDHNWRVSVSTICFNSAFYQPHRR
ncbi:putative divalent cation/proton antiporter TMEM165 isoform X2 [Calliopsis andreniformis]|uniref:putative divalent cation/proton antiporter TMEM165 isoform X2 n=1 Tax=Calliopsis andreniformis TaxID=337506 RepID=UPI003FCD5B2D